MGNLSTPSWSHKNEPWARNTSLPRSSHSLCWTYHLVCEYLSLFHTQPVRICLSVIWRMANLTAISISFKKGMGSFVLWHKRVACRPRACVSCWEGPAGCGGPMPTIRADLALSLLCVRIAFFHPVLDCVVFSFVTPIPRYSGQNSLDFYSW